MRWPGAPSRDDATVKLACSPLPSLAELSQRMLGPSSREAYCSGVCTPLDKEDKEDVEEEARWRLTLRGAHARLNGKEFFRPSLKASLTFD